MGEYLKVEGHQDLVRDTRTGAILNKNDTNPYLSENNYSGDINSHQQYKTGKIKIAGTIKQIVFSRTWATPTNISK